MPITDIINVYPTLGVYYTSVYVKYQIDYLH